MAEKPGAVVHVEFHSANPERTKAFFSKVFGWKFQDIPEMDYTTFEAPSGPGGGLQKPGETMGPGILNYILSDEINDTARAIQAAGGAMVIPKSEIPGIGWFAIFRDPTGLTMALYQELRKEAPRPAAKDEPKAEAKPARGRSGRR